MGESINTLKALGKSSILPASTLFSHGPKGHAGAEFAALQAVKKGVTWYDRLVKSGKLEESWERG